MYLCTSNEHEFLRVFMTLQKTVFSNVMEKTLYLMQEKTKAVEYAPEYIIYTKSWIAHPIDEILSNT